MAVGPIPFSAIHAYGARYGVDGEDFDYFVRMVRAMEQAVNDPGATGRRRQVGRSLSPELFDALFG